MRVSTRYQFESYSRDIAASHARFMESQRQLASGKRVQSISDDPIGAVQIINLSSVRSAVTQYQKNLKHASAVASSAEGAFSEASLLLKRASQLTIQGANATLDASAREGVRKEIEAIQNRMIEIGNSRGPNNEFIFSGQMIDTKPFTITNTGLVYNGDTNPIHAEVGPGETLQINTLGNQLFTDSYNALESVKAHLVAGDLSSLGGADLAAINNARDAVDQQRGSIGARLQSIERMDAAHSRRAEELSVQVSDIEEVDMSEAVTKYKLAETAYQAALQVASQGFRMGLMDFIRG